MSHQDPFVDKNTDVPGDRAHDPAHKKLPQEVTFDKAVYGGISYFTQAAVGIVLTNWLNNGGGRKYFDKIGEWAGPAFISKITNKKGAEAVKEASSWIIVSSMIMVGNLFVAPVKLLENNKPQIVRRMTEWNNKRREARGEHVSDEEHAAQEARLTQLEQEPKQSWTSLLLGRAFGLAGVYGTIYLLGNRGNQVLENTAAETVKNLSNAAGLKAIAESKTVENYTRISAYDFFYSIVAAGGLYVYSHFLHPSGKHGKSAKNEPANPAAPEAPAAPALVLAAPEAPANLPTTQAVAHSVEPARGTQKKSLVAHESHQNMLAHAETTQMANAI